MFRSVFILAAVAAFCSFVPAPFAFAFPMAAVAPVPKPIDRCTLDGICAPGNNPAAVGRPCGDSSECTATTCQGAQCTKGGVGLIRCSNEFDCKVRRCVGDKCPLA